MVKTSLSDRQPSSNGVQVNIYNGLILLGKIARNWDAGRSLAHWTASSKRGVCTVHKPPIHLSLVNNYSLLPARLTFEFLPELLMSFRLIDRRDQNNPATPFPIFIQKAQANHNGKHHRPSEPSTPSTLRTHQHIIWSLQNMRRLPWICWRRTSKWRPVVPSTGTSWPATGTGEFYYYLSSMMIPIVLATGASMRPMLP